MNLERRVLIEAAYTAAWCERQPLLGPRVLRDLLDPQPAARVLSKEDAENAAKDHAELASMFDSLAETQRRARDAGGGKA